MIERKVVGFVQQFRQLNSVITLLLKLETIILLSSCSYNTLCTQLTLTIEPALFREHFGNRDILLIEGVGNPEILKNCYFTKCFVLLSWIYYQVA